MGCAINSRHINVMYAALLNTFLLKIKQTISTLIGLIIPNTIIRIGNYCDFYCSRIVCPLIIFDTHDVSTSIL